MSSFIGQPLVQCFPNSWAEVINYLQDMQVGDKINSMKVVDGMQFLQRPKPAAPKADPVAPTEA